MKLKDDFFQILNCRETDGQTEYLVQLNVSHHIYRNHFPENPVTPGVCLVQIIKELLAEKIETEVIMCEASRIRYLKVINPLEDSLVTFSMNIACTENCCAVAATVFSDTDVFAKLALKYRPLVSPHVSIKNTEKLEVFS